MSRRTRTWLGGLLVGVSLLSARPAAAGGTGPPICSACNYRIATYKVEVVVVDATAALHYDPLSRDGQA